MRTINVFIFATCLPFALTATLRSQDLPKPGDVKAQVSALLQDALKDLELVEDAHTKFRGLSQCAVLQAKSGDAKGSQQTFAVSKEMIKIFGQEQTVQSNFWSLLTPDYAKANNVAEMKKMLETFPPPGPNYRGPPELAKGAIVRDCALELAKIGNEKDALELAKSVIYYKPVDVRNEVLREIALRSASAGDWNAVQKTLDSISTPKTKIFTLAGMTFANVQGFALELPHRSGIAQIQDKQGDHRAALTSLRKAMALASELKGREQDQGWSSILCTQAQLGEIAAAHDSLAHISVTSPFYLMALSAIAKAQAAAGQEQAALATIEKVVDPKAKLNALAHVIVGLAQSGNKQAVRAAAEKALEIAKSMSEPMRRALLLNLVRAQALSKDFEGAFKSAALTGAFERGAIYPSIAYWQGMHGDVRGALKTMEEHRNANVSAWAGNLEALAFHQAQRGQVNEALAWIRDQTAPEIRAYGLIGVARGLLEPESAAKKK